MRDYIAVFLTIFILILSSFPSSLIAFSSSHSRIVSIQIWDYEDMGPNDYVQIAESGFNTVEFQLFWSNIEPEPNQFDFYLLTQNVKWAEEAGLNFILIFWYGPFQPSWVKGYELNSSYEPVGNTALGFAPPWWDYMNVYINYVNTTISQFLNDTHFLGAYINYGWLDGFWLGGGYSNSSIQHFRDYLREEYGGNISALNKAWGTDYSSFSQILPPTTPSDSRSWIDFEDYRIWALNYTLNRIYSAVYPELEAHGKRIFIYWGGDIQSSWWSVGFPDVILQVAKKYDAIINIDDNDYPYVEVFIRDLAEAYGVGVMEEWTPPALAEYNQADFSYSLAQYLSALPTAVGYDYFAYPYQWEVTGTSGQFEWLLNVTRGLPQNLSYLNAKVAYLYSFQADIENPPLGNGQQQEVYEMIYSGIPFQVISDFEIENGVVNLSRFKYIVIAPGEMEYLPQGVKAQIDKWESNGGVLVSFDELGKISYLRGVYFPHFPNTFQHIEVSYLRANSSSLYLIVLASPYSPFGSYERLPKDLTLEVSLSALDLSPGYYRVVNVSNGKVIYEGQTMVFNITLSTSMASIYVLELQLVTPIHTTVTPPRPYSKALIATIIAILVVALVILVFIRRH
ncbi:MAG: beta-galactosidase [Sulfolobaceae archaeon]|nr:beta-galactosidase [Sulfolobaceae archaeon]